MNKTFIMLSGLPRSGSTVLSSMLNQHPKFHATATSPVADLLTNIDESWTLLHQSLVNPDPRQYANMINGLIDGVYKHINKPVIIDKNRLWPKYGKFMSYVLGSRPKVICTVRNIPDILASYILLLSKNPNHGFVDDDLIAANLPLTLKNRCKILWEKYTFHPYTSFRIGYQASDIDICLVEYDDIINNPQAVMDKVCEFIGVDSIILDTNNLQKIEENDNYHGGLTGLHDIRPVLKKTSPESNKVIGQELVRQYTNMKLDFWHKPRPVINEQVISQLHEALPGDSYDYEVLYNAVKSIKNVPGLICEIGVRRGGSLRYIFDAITTFDEIKTVVAIDPYGNLEYRTSDTETYIMDYTNDMKNESWTNIYDYVRNKNINLIFFNLEDTEFFEKYNDGVPVYINNKEIINDYSLVFFDGPHDVQSIMDEVNFFIPRINSNGIFVFDDLQYYDHDTIHEYLLNNNFELIEIGPLKRKASYRRKELL